MKRNRLVYLLIIPLILLVCCTPVRRLWVKLQNVNSHGYDPFCRMIEITDTVRVNAIREDVYRYGLRKYDTVVSIGVGSGWREFMLSVFADSITFYLEDIDTTCITHDKINNKYLPYYSKFREKPITNCFIPILGSDSTIDIKSSVANTILIINVYHHFSNDLAMINECKRILKKGGKLFIDEHVLRRNKYSFKFCDYGGYYKSENNFVKDIEKLGLTCDTIYRFGEYGRSFVFSN